MNQSPTPGSEKKASDHAALQKPAAGVAAGGVVGAVLGGPFGAVVGALVGGVMETWLHSSQQKITAPRSVASKKSGASVRKPRKPKPMGRIKAEVVKSDLEEAGQPLHLTAPAARVTKKPSKKTALRDAEKGKQVRKAASKVSAKKATATAKKQSRVKPVRKRTKS